MATNKRDRQRQQRQVAQKQAKSTATRTQLRSRGVRIGLIAAVVIVAVLVLWLVTRSGGGDSEPETVTTAAAFPELPTPPSPGAELSGQPPCPDLDGENARVTLFDSPFPMCLTADQQYTAVINTTAGEIRVNLDLENSPNTVNAFAALAEYHYYDGSAIFYTDPGGGYVQGGSPHTNDFDDPGPGFTVASDDNYNYQAGQLIWAPTQDAIGQFILTGTDDFEPPASSSGHSVLGQIDAATLPAVLDILVDHVDDPDTAFGGRPANTVTINSIQILTNTSTNEGTIDMGACPPTDGSAEQVLSFDEPQPMCLEPNGQYTAVFDTTAGEIRVDLDLANTPITANNFAVLARYRYYDNTLLFRTDPSIGIIQGGSPHTNSPSDPGPGYTIPDEGQNHTYEPGQLVMARTGAPNSAGAQFFFAVNENTALLNSQGTYVVFGRFSGDSLTVAEQILASHADQPNNPLGGAPDPQVIINSITILEAG